eukprot:SAG31_NODE_3896_length_3772_cov_12.045467_5_plen_40_part_01
MCTRLHLKLNMYTATSQTQQDPTNGIAVPRRDTGAYGAYG